MALASKAYHMFKCGPSAAPRTILLFIDKTIITPNEVIKLEVENV